MSSLIGILVHGLDFTLPVTNIILMPFLSPLSRATAVPQWLACVLQWTTCDSKAQVLGVGWRKLLAKCRPVVELKAQSALSLLPHRGRAEVPCSKLYFPFPRNNAILAPIATHPPLAQVKSMPLCLQIKHSVVFGHWS